MDLPQSIPTVEIPDEKDKRFSVLSYDQVQRLNDLMSDEISIQGRGNFPTLKVRLTDLVRLVKKKLEEDGIAVQNILLNGSSASSVLAPGDANISYNDLDLIFSVGLNPTKAFDKVKNAVMDTLMELLPAGVSRLRMSSCSLKEAYVTKMVKVTENDRWSLIALGNNNSKSVELKFVSNMKRQYEFSVDSFHIMLDNLFLFYECCSEAPIAENFYPTVVAESMYGDIKEALYHLQEKLIASKNPEEIRGGGLLKYCNLLCQGYKPASPKEVKTTEMYMCSRFFIDFPNVNLQRAKLEKYLCTHFQTSEDRLKYDYLMILYQVVDESTVCLMRHEHQLTLSMIEEMAYHIYAPSPYYAMYEPSVEDPYISGRVCASAISPPLSTCSSLATGSSSKSTSGLSTPHKPESPAPTPPQVSTTTPTGILQPVHYNNSSQKLQMSVPPTYEIMTSCKSTSVVYSNGYYYTSFTQPTTIVSTTPPSVASPPATDSTTTCPACAVSSGNAWPIQHQQIHPQQAITTAKN